MCERAGWHKDGAARESQVEEHIQRIRWRSGSRAEAPRALAAELPVDGGPVSGQEQHVQASDVPAMAGLS